MPTNKFTSKTREELLQFYMNALKEDTIPWEKGWSGGEPNHNEISGARYRGINQSCGSGLKHIRRSTQIHAG